MSWHCPQARFQRSSSIYRLHKQRTRIESHNKGWQLSLLCFSLLSHSAIYFQHLKNLTQSDLLTFFLWIKIQTRSPSLWTKTRTRTPSLWTKPRLPFTMKLISMHTITRAFCVWTVTVCASKQSTVRILSLRRADCNSLSMNLAHCHDPNWGQDPTSWNKNAVCLMNTSTSVSSMR